MLPELLSDGAEYLTPAVRAARGVTLDDLLSYLGGKPTQGQVMRNAGQLLNDVTFDKFSKPVGKLVGSKFGRVAARAVPGLSAVSNVMDVADVIAGDESFANKAMDVGAMGIGTVAGAFMGGPLGASIGASAGKALSDGVQGLFGGGQSPEERKLAEALAQLNGGRV